jgi:hypothetical protein
VVAQLLAGCGQTVEVGVDYELTNGASAGAGGALQVAGSPSSDGGVAGSQDGAPPCVETECRGQLLQCGNCTDDDSDGVIDAFDPDCLGPCDDDENGLSSGMVAMQTATCKQDCYFDGNSGVGNDQCQWSHKCDPESVAPDYPPSGEARCEYDPTGQGSGLDCETWNNEQASVCLDTCLPLVPNGCDCFGCCELSDGKTHFIGKGRGALGCQRDAIDDPVTCPPCTQVESCLNPCEDCEVCVGRPLPAGCSGGNVCPPGQAACTTDAPCDFQEYCVTGCCVRPPEPV